MKADTFGAAASDGCDRVPGIYVKVCITSVCCASDRYFRTEDKCKLTGASQGVTI